LPLGLGYVHARQVEQSYPSALGPFRDLPRQLDADILFHLPAGPSSLPCSGASYRSPSNRRLDQFWGGLRRRVLDAASLAAATMGIGGQLARPGSPRLYRRGGGHARLLESELLGRSSRHVRRRARVRRSGPPCEWHKESLCALTLDRFRGPGAG